MADAIQLREAEPQTADGLVEAIEELLEGVKSGEIREVAWAARMTGSEIQTSLCGEADDVFRMLGAVRYLEERVIRSID